LTLAEKRSPKTQPKISEDVTIPITSSNHRNIDVAPLSAKPHSKTSPLE